MKSQTANSRINLDPHHDDNTVTINGRKKTESSTENVSHGTKAIPGSSGMV